MVKLLSPLLTVLFLSFFGVGADYCLKLAGRDTLPVKSAWFWIGAAAYFSTAFAWVYVLRHVKLSSIGVIYSFGTSGALILVGVFGFGESLNRREMFGIALGLVSLGLLARFS